MVQFTSYVQLFRLGVCINGSVYWRYIMMLRHLD
ncbi:hypothetical protein Ccrd_013240 [Cynara cardunculus var. scolymus]|uniref:Uncharacterized protein n=1 Tax=Cynara cardunculus var. scolymus TaxID=59895 RepID=A0A124SH44_CYNCS|nr:hypothetical protein Ccrd_013240 [Cynara cardunculus var. scolymus]